MTATTDARAGGGGGGSGGGGGPYVCIYASQVAMCIGANKHKKISEAMETTWQRVAPAAFHAAMKRNNVKTEEETAADIIGSHAELKGLVQLTLESPCESSDQVARQYDSVARELRCVAPSLPEGDRKLVDDVLKRNLYTSYGNVNEHSVVTYIRDTLGIQCHEDPTFYKRQQGVCTGSWGTFQWFVGGKIDAIDADRTLLIEIKNRVNRLFYRIPFYEQVQVQAYLHLLGLERGVLVECLKTRQVAGDRVAVQAPDRRPEGGSSSLDTAVNVVSVRRDPDLWERDIVPQLQGFVDFLAHLMHDPAMQDRYLQSTRRSAMITTFINKNRRGINKLS